MSSSVYDSQMLRVSNAYLSCFFFPPDNVKCDFYFFRLLAQSFYLKVVGVVTLLLVLSPSDFSCCVNPEFSFFSCIFSAIWKTIYRYICM